MLRRFAMAVLGGVLALALWSGSAGSARAQSYAPLNRYFYYPYYYFPHNYWPATSGPWPGPNVNCSTNPPAYMAYPPFREPHWRYEAWQPQLYYRGVHFWLDQL
jgi:hypothetical protein